MRIAVLQDHLRSGGTEKHSVLLADAFAQHGHESLLLSFRPGGALCTQIKAARHEALQPIDLKWDGFAPGLIRRLKRFSPDVILCMGREANGKAAGLVQALPDATVVCTFRTGRPLTTAYRTGLKRAAGIISNSRAAARTLTEREGMAETQIRVIHNAVELPAQQSQEARKTLRTALGATEGTRVLVDVAMFREGKGHEALLTLCSKLSSEPDWQLWLVGEGPQRRPSERLARHLGLTNRVRFLGWQARPGEYIAAADVAVHASQTEALSNFLIEAQLMGLPVVALEAQGNDECLIPGETGFLFRRDDGPGFITQLQQLLSEAEAPRTLRAQQAREFAQKRFEPQRCITAHLDYFMELRARCNQGSGA